MPEDYNEREIKLALDEKHRLMREMRDKYGITREEVLDLTMAAFWEGWYSQRRAAESLANA
jgi:hypothetical protein